MGLMLVSFSPSARGDRAKANAVAGGVALGALAGIACWTGSLAEGDEDASNDVYARRGWLLGLTANYATEFFEDDVESSLRAGSPAAYFSLNNSLGLKGRAGCRIHRRFSTDVAVEWLDGFEGTAFVDGYGSVAELDYKPVVVTTNLKGHILTGRFQPFLLVGGGMMTAGIEKRKSPDPAAPDLPLPERDRNTEFALRFGAGIDVYATKRIALTLETNYVLPVDELEDLQYLSVGLGVQYRF